MSTARGPRWFRARPPQCRGGRTRGGWAPRRADLGALVAQAVARAADGLELGDAERAVDLVAQVADVDVDDVRAVLVVVVPGVLEQLVAREDLAGVAHERLEELELLGRQVHLVL